MSDLNNAITQEALARHNPASAGAKTGETTIALSETTMSMIQVKRAFIDIKTGETAATEALKLLKLWESERETRDLYLEGKTLPGTWQGSPENVDVLNRLATYYNEGGAKLLLQAVERINSEETPQATTTKFGALSIKFEKMLEALNSLTEIECHLNGYFGVTEPNTQGTTTGAKKTNETEALNTLVRSNEGKLKIGELRAIHNVLLKTDSGYKTWSEENCMYERIQKAATFCEDTFQGQDWGGDLKVNLADLWLLMMGTGKLDNFLNITNKDDGDMDEDQRALEQLAMSLVEGANSTDTKSKAKHSTLLKKRVTKLNCTLTTKALVERVAILALAESTFDPQVAQMYSQLYHQLKPLVDLAPLDIMNLLQSSFKYRRQVSAKLGFGQGAQFYSINPLNVDLWEYLQNGSLRGGSPDHTYKKDITTFQHKVQEARQLKQQMSMTHEKIKKKKTANAKEWSALSAKEREPIVAFVDDQGVSHHYCMKHYYGPKGKHPKLSQECKNTKSSKMFNGGKMAKLGCRYNNGKFKIHTN